MLVGVGGLVSVPCVGSRGLTLTEPWWFGHPGRTKRLIAPVKDDAGLGRPDADLGADLQAGCVGGRIRPRRRVAVQ